MGEAHLSASHWHAEEQYTLVRHTWDNLWVEECASHHAVACQQLLNNCATHDHQEANRCQQLLDKRAANLLPLVARYVYLWGDGLPIHSVLVA